MFEERHRPQRQFLTLVDQTAIADEDIVSTGDRWVGPGDRHIGAEPDDLRAHAVIIFQRGLPSRFRAGLEHRGDGEFDRDRGEVAPLAGPDLGPRLFLVVYVDGLGISRDHPQRDEGQALRPRRDRPVGGVTVLELNRQRLQFLAAVADGAGARDEELEHGNAVEMRLDRLMRLQLRHGRLRSGRGLGRGARPEEDGAPMLDPRPRGNHNVPLGQRIGATARVDHGVPLRLFVTPDHSLRPP